MISIIICSVNKNKRDNTIASIVNTIGVPYEIIIKENITNDSICSVYNECAYRANGDYLCFVHEDVIFNSDNWGKIIIEHIESVANCGIIGLAGTTYVSRFHTKWWNVGEIIENYRTITSKQDNTLVRRKTTKINENFSNVLLLDGFFLFCHKSIFLTSPFDSSTFTGFHFYDIDFCFSKLLLGYDNYVCNVIDVSHLSNGNCNYSHYNAATLFRQKYHKSLPMYSKKNRIRIFQRFGYELYSLISLYTYSKNFDERDSSISKEIKNISKPYYIIFNLLRPIINLTLKFVK